MTALTAAELAEIKDRADAATPGPWSAVLGSGAHLCTAIVGADGATVVADLLPDWVLADGCAPPDHVPNLRFIEAARTDVHRLVTEVERLNTLLNRYRSESTFVSAAAKERRKELRNAQAAVKFAVRVERDRCVWGSRRSSRSVASTTA